MEEKQKFKQNLLTQGLLAAGYTVDDHPDYVVIKDYYVGGKSLDNYHGGFSFERKWSRKQTFRTPCGLLCKVGSATAAWATWASNGFSKTTWRQWDAPMKRPTVS